MDRLDKDGIGKWLFRRSTKSIVARVVDEAVNVIYLVRMLCVRIILTDKLDDLVLVHQPRIAAKDQEWCIG